MRLNCSLAPAATPVPQSPVHSLTPSGWIVQPCDLSSAVAPDGLYLYGEPFTYWLTYGLSGLIGTGPLVGQPYPLNRLLTNPFWSISICIAWRKYSCLKIGPTVGLAKLNGM